MVALITSLLLLLALGLMAWRHRRALRQAHAALEQSRQQTAQLQQLLDNLQGEVSGQASRNLNYKERAKSILSEAFYAGGDAAERTARDLAAIVDTVQRTAGMTHDIHLQGNEAQRVAGQGMAVMRELRDSASACGDIRSGLHELRGLMESIDRKSQVINKIASQAELLSFNAAIEAARAGSQGRGFAVVAEDIKRLARLSADSAADIGAIIRDALKDVGVISSAIEDRMDTTARVSEQAAESFMAVEQTIAEVSDVVATLSSGIEDAIGNVNRLGEASTTSLESISTLLSKAIGVVGETEIVDLSPEEVLRRKSEFTIIDVRRPDEFHGDLGHIEGARLHCLQDHFKQSLQGLDRQKPYLFVCRSGGRSARAARIALVEGFEAVYNMQGGMLEWNSKRQPVSR